MGYRIAARRTTSLPERRYLEARAARLAEDRPLGIVRKEDDVNDKPEEKGGETRNRGAVRLIDVGDLEAEGTAYEFQGTHHDASISFILVDAPPGGGPKLHRHPYEEVFVVQEGTVTFTVGDEEIEARGGQVVVVPAGVAHRFVNSGTGRLRQVDIHPSGRFVTEWLED